MDNTYTYQEIIDRNIGLITEEQQQKLKHSCVAVFGLGGLGGVISEILVRSGISSLKILDNDKFESQNLNRQIFSFKDTIGRYKTDVTEEFLKKINPEVKIEKFIEATEENIMQILTGVNVAVLAIDKTKPCLIIARAACKLGIPLVEGWAIPFGNVRVITKDTISLEELYNLATINRKVEEISEEEFNKMNLTMLETLPKIEGLGSYYNARARKRIMSGENTTFAPLVWLTAVSMSLETIKVLLNWGNITLAPKIALYDPFLNRIPKQSI